MMSPALFAFFLSKRRLFETPLYHSSATIDGGTMERVKHRGIIADNLGKPVGVWATSLV
jgi:hypothetical protein